MANIKFLNRIVLLAFLIVLIAGCTSPNAPDVQKQPVIDETAKEIVDTGILFVDSYPTAAQVYLDGELKGDSPSTIENVPVGEHNLVVKKQGYADFEKKVKVTVGIKEEVEARLNLLAPIKDAAMEGETKTGEIVENASSSASKLKTIDISKSYIMYFDFVNEYFTDITTATPDIFSTRYNNYVGFTAFSPVTMKVLNKPIKDVKKEDCIIGYDTIGDVYSEQTLCVKTRKGLIAVIGGSWKTSPQILEWELFS